MFVRFSKIEYYLIDNQYIFMLSQLTDEVNGKADGLRSRFQIGNLSSQITFTQMSLSGPA
jgi:hypothetical protein